MAELTINNLIKIILGLVVVAVVVGGLVFAFKTSVIDFFRNIVPQDEAPIAGIFLGLIR